ncbi:MAG: hypothetical protein ACKOWF_12435 [Chloroflexota bacterium]
MPRPTGAARTARRTGAAINRQRTSPRPSSRPPSNRQWTSPRPSNRQPSNRRSLRQRWAASAARSARPIDLELIGNGKVQAVLGYTEDEVRWILAHPKFLDGEPYAQVTEALSRRGSSLIARYADPGAMAGKLAGLGWIDGYQRVFSLGWPPATVPGYVDVTVSRFRDGASAVSAVDALAGQMIADGGMLQVPWGPYGEKAIGFTGSDINGMQRVGFAAAGPYLITVTAVAPQGDPVATVNGIVAYIIETVSAGG